MDAESNESKLGGRLILTIHAPRFLFMYSTVTLSTDANTTASCEFGSIAGEIIAGITERYFDVLKTAPIRICPPAHATPTSPALTKEFYPGAMDIVEAVAKLIGRELESQSLNDQRIWPHDVPGDWFKGPF